MFIRETKTINKKTGNIYITHKLVESYQTEKGPRQRVIMSLGHLSIPKKLWKNLARIIESKLMGQAFIFKEDEELEKIAEENINNYLINKKINEQKEEKNQKAEYVNIDLNTVDVIQHRSIGPELVGHKFWELLNFNKILSNCGLKNKEIESAKAVILGRLIEPGSENSTIEWLKNRTGLSELSSFEEIHTKKKSIDKNDIYEIGCKLFQNKEKIERDLSETKRNIFQANSTLFLYDLTNFHFEGQEKKNKLAKRGKSKQKRDDCQLVTMALAVDEDGFPLFSEIYEGNQSEPETINDVLQKIEKKNGFKMDQTMMLAMDRGIATKENISLMNQKGYNYVVIERADITKKYKDEFENYKEEFKIIANKEEDEKVYIKTKEEKREIEYKDESNNKEEKKIIVKEIEITRVLSVSEGRKEKEDAIDAGKEKRFLEDVKRLMESNKKGNIKIISKVYERVGKIKQRYSSIVKYYDIQIKENEDKTEVVSIECIKKEKREERKKLTGCYVIETNKKGLTGEKIWELYMTLTKVENAFKSLKSQLGTRPIFHQTAERTKAHLFISVLAYYILICIEHSLKQAGDNRTWKTIKKVLSTHQQSIISLEDDKNNIYHLYVSNTNELAHHEIYNALKVKNPLKRKKYIVARNL